MIIKDALLKCNDYSCARDILENTKLTCPVYLMIAGINGTDGVSITRERDSALYVDELTKDRWFILQTN